MLTMHEQGYGEAYPKLVCPSGAGISLVLRYLSICMLCLKGAAEVYIKQAQSVTVHAKLSTQSGYTHTRPDGRIDAIVVTKTTTAMCGHNDDGDG